MAGLPGIPTIEQYNSAYPQLHYDQPPCPQNGYGWSGNGYGWQLSPDQWKSNSVYPSLDNVDGAGGDEEVQAPAPIDEPVIVEQKVTKQNAVVSFDFVC